MPRTNPRPRGPEADVAARVALEREQRGMSAAELARRMTETGCSLNQSAINKIEQANPPRRITVDELVAFAKVFGLEVEDLLVPAHAARDRAIEAAYRGFAEAADEIDVLTRVAERQLQRLNELTGAAYGEELAAAQTNCQSAHAALQRAVEAVSDDIRFRLRKHPPTLAPDRKPRTSDLQFRPSKKYDERAAVAASPSPLPTAKKGRQKKGSTRGQHPEAP